MPFVVNKQVLFREPYPVFLYRVWLNTLYSAPRYPIPCCMVGYRVNGCKSVNIKKKRTEKDKKDTATFSESEVSKSCHAAGSLLPSASADGFKD